MVKIRLLLIPPRLRIKACARIIAGSVAGYLQSSGDDSKRIGSGNLDREAPRVPVAARRRAGVGGVLDRAGRLLALGIAHPNHAETLAYLVALDELLALLLEILDVRRAAGDRQQGERDSGRSDDSPRGGGAPARNAGLAS